jgi:hypothetical protein
MNGVHEGHGIDSDSYGWCLCMTDCSKSTGFVSEFHNHATMYIAQPVCVLRAHHVTKGDTRIGDLLSIHE